MPNHCPACWQEEISDLHGEYQERPRDEHVCTEEDAELSMELWAVRRAESGHAE